MPLPSEVHLDQFLTNFLIGKTNGSMIADDVAPPITSAKTTGVIAKIDDSHLRVDFSARAPGTNAQRIEWGTEQTPFNAEEFRLEHPVDDIVAEQYDDPYDAFREGSMVLQSKIDLKKEKLVATLMTTAGNYGSTFVGAAWSAAGDPIVDVQRAIEEIQDRTGEGEDVMEGVCSYQVMRLLRTNAKVKENYLNTVAGAADVGKLSQAQVASTLGLSRLHVGSKIEVTSAEGATKTFAPIWGTNVFGVFVKPAITGIMVPAFAVQVYPTVPGFAGAQTAVDRYRDETVSSEIIRARILLDEVVGEADFGTFISGIT